MTKPLAVVEKYDGVVNYIYPIIQNIPRKHGKFRDALLEAIFKVPGLIYTAAKSNQVSKVYRCSTC